MDFNNNSTFIDRTNLDYFLMNHGQNTIGPSLEQIISEVGKIETISDIARLLLYIRRNFQQDKEHKIKKFVRTSEEIAESKIWSGCSDMGTLVAPILRENGIPTVYLQSARLDWINDLLENNNQKSLVRGHIFLEVLINDEWILLDPTMGCFYTNYNYRNLSLPGNYYVFSKSLNGHEVGCDSLSNNNKIMTALFQDFDINSYQDPNYVKIDACDVLQHNANKSCK